MFGFVLVLSCILAKSVACPEPLTTVHIQNYDGPIILHAANCDSQRDYFSKYDTDCTCASGAKYNQCPQTPYYPTANIGYQYDQPYPKSYETECTCVSKVPTLYTSQSCPNIGYKYDQPYYKSYETECTCASKVPTLYTSQACPIICGQYDQLGSKQYDTECTCVSKVPTLCSQVGYPNVGYPNGGYPNVGSQNGGDAKSLIYTMFDDKINRIANAGCQYKSGSYC